MRKPIKRKRKKGKKGDSLAVPLFPPAADRPDLVLWALWSRSRNEEVEGVYSHQTALSMHDLSDLNPAKLHMTVPTHFRRNNAIPGILVLHYADLAGGDVQTAQGSKFTRPLRPILDLIEADTVERSFIRQALRQALDRGLITRQQIRNTQLSGPARKIIEQVNRSCGGMHNGASTSFSLSASSFAREYNNGKYFPSSHNGTRSA